MMTLRQLAERAAQIVQESPQLAELPVFLSNHKSRRTTEYLPILYVSGGTLKVGDMKMVEMSVDMDNMIIFPPPNKRKKKDTDDD